MKKATDYGPEILRLFDGYVHGKITRRQFLDRAAADLAWQRTLAFFEKKLT
jgi:dienelactone hydrolase